MTDKLIRFSIDMGDSQAFTYDFARDLEDALESAEVNNSMLPDGISETLDVLLAARDLHAFTMITLAFLHRRSGSKMRLLFENGLAINLDAAIDAASMEKAVHDAALPGDPTIDPPKPRRH